MRFDPTTHTFWRGRRRVVSVTEVLAAAPAPWATAVHADRGSWVHAATATRDRGDRLVDDEVPPAYRGYLDAHRAAVAQLRPIWLRIEQPLYHPQLDLAGMPDRIGIINGHVTVLDLKTGGPAAWHSLQTAGYAWLATRVMRRPPEEFARWALYLRPDGTFTLTRHADDAELDAFRRALLQYREEHTPDDHTHPQLVG